MHSVFWVWVGRRLWLSLGAALLTASVAHAVTHAVAHAQEQEPARRQAFVYGLTNYNGSVYASALASPSVDTLYLLSDRENVIAPRQTLIYFWPVTNQYLADWEKMNKLVEGALEVHQNGRLVKALPLSPYVIQYDTNDPEGTLNLYTGANAQAKYDEWQAMQESYRDGLVAYYQALGERDEQITKLRQESPDGVIPPEKVPKRPEPPRRPTLLSTNPAQGYVVALPAGTYDIQVRRTDGGIQPDSYKRLVMFDKQRDGVAYSVVPQSRWNLPEQSDEPDSVVYALPGATLYLQAFKASLYNDYEYSHMLDPQDQATQPDRGKWVSFDPVTKPRMRLKSGDHVISELSSQPYLVRQLPGSGLGYEVVPFDSNKMEQATFDGYAINLDVPGAGYEVELVDESGAPIPGSQRRVMTLYAERALLPYFLSALPLVVGVGVLVTRHRRTRQIKVEE